MNIRRIIAAIAAVWGALVVGSYLIGFNSIRGEGAYASGQYFGIFLGLLLLIAGIYSFMKTGRKKTD
jgi:hypothetical protein